MIKIYTFIATFGYVGFLPKMPGTWGSLAAAGLIYLLGSQSLIFNLLIIFGLFILGVISTKHIECEMNIDDPGYIVIDEVVGMWIAVLALPVTLPVLICGFILFRIFDIWKPWFIDSSQSIPNGIGVMVDDVLAGMFALVINYFIFASGLLY